MSSAEVQHSEVVCPKCGAIQPSQLKACWLCSAEIMLDSNEATPVDLVQAAPERFSFSLSTLLLLMTLASVCFGLLAVDIGLGIPFCVLLVPVLVRTMMVVRRREAAGQPVSSAEKFSLMICSFGVASVLAAVVSVAAFASCCGVLLVLFSADNHYGGGGMFVFGVGMCVVAALALWGSFHVVKWVRRRYRRDVGESGEGFTAEAAENAEED